MARRIVRATAFLADLFQTSILGGILVAPWLPFGALWAHFWLLWVPFGLHWAPFRLTLGALGAHFGCSGWFFTPFWCSMWLGHCDFGHVASKTIFLHEFSKMFMKFLRNTTVYNFCFKDFMNILIKTLVFMH